MVDRDAWREARNRIGTVHKDRWQETINLCQSLLDESIFAEHPRAEDFAVGVKEKLDSLQDQLDNGRPLTSRQEEMLENILEGIRRWVR